MTAPGTGTYKLAAKSALLAVAALIAWKAISLGLNTRYPVDYAALTANPDTDNAAVALVLARQAGDAGPDSRAQARDVVLGVLAKRPADGRLFRALAQLDKDNPELARRRWQAAALLRPADVETLAWLADDAVSRGDFSEALDHCDAVLRVSPAQARNLFPILSTWLQTGAATPALTRTLERRPPWRRSFMEYMAREGVENSLYTFSQVVQALRNSPAPADANEARPLVNRLVHDGDFERAYLLWRSVLPALQASTGMLYNGGFEMPASGAAFDWTLRSTQGVAVSVEDGGPARGNSLRLRFGGVRVAEIGVEQTLLLPPGGYRLLGEVRSQDLESAQGLEWRIYCLAKPSRMVAAVPVAVESDRDWSDFDLELDVPADGCPAQLLQLTTRARVATEQTVSGTAWFDNFRLEAQGLAASPAPALPQGGRRLASAWNGN
ncbi:hypothetical protein DFR29_12099 [Tahibacter aquaticus]|uniref:Uncharacterized protein n=1 Tax=Tahibacter aquaticus TaxID=520092 RepID=A0A4R6YMF5_9GAMM|nr:hypothetical protein [Tahibacter aquaticus]TDR38598.1 hypothetical protein DFR29_12099 [Tahibacter aquaticus]